VSKEITYLNYVTSITADSRIEAGSAGGQIVWKETAPSHSKPSEIRPNADRGGEAMVCKGAKLQAESR